MVELNSLFLQVNILKKSLEASENIKCHCRNINEYRINENFIKNIINDVICKEIIFFIKIFQIFFHFFFQKPCKKNWLFVVRNFVFDEAIPYSLYVVDVKLIFFGCVNWYIGNKQKPQIQIFSKCVFSLINLIK